MIINNIKYKIKDGPIFPDDKFARKIGFTRDKFDSYLWKDGDSIYISVIISKQPGKGNFSKLINNILKMGYKVKVPIPLGLMRLILLKKGLKKTYEWDYVYMDYVEVWVKEPDDYKSKKRRRK